MPPDDATDPPVPAAAPADRIATLGPAGREALDLLVVLDLLPPVETHHPNPHVQRHAAGIAELRRAGLVAPDDPLRYADPSVRAAVFAVLPTERTEGARRNALDLAIDTGAPTEVLAPLAAACRPSGDPLIVDILSAAADAALRSQDAETALTWLRRALGEPCSDGEAMALRSQLALASALAGESGATTLIRRSALDLPPLDGAHLIRRGAALLAGRGRAREATELIEDVRNRLGTSNPEATSVLSIAWITSARHDTSLRATVRRRIAEGGLGVELDPSPSGRALAGIEAYELALVGRDRGKVVELAHHALDRRAGGSLVIDLASIWVSVLALTFAGDLDAASEALDRLEQRGTLRDREGDVLVAHHLRATVERHRGRLDEARASAALVADAIATGWRGSLPGGAGNRCRLALLAGDLAAAEAALELPGGLAAFADDPSMVEYFDARGRLHACRSRYAEALEDHLRVRDRHRDLGAPNPAPVLWADGAARALTALGRRTEALDLLAEQVGLARVWGAPRPLGVLLTTTGSIRRDREGDTLIDEALALLTTAGLPVELAVAHLARADVAQRHGDRRSTERHARRAAKLAGTAGAVVLERDARRTLATTPVGAGGSGTGLTAAERRVATLAAEGRSNADIAGLLFVSRKAVEFHLSNAYRKLGIAGRRELATTLAEEAAPGPGTER